MQNKGAIRVIAIIFALVCLYQLSFTYYTKKVESNAKEYASNGYARQQAKLLANGDRLREQEILDSISTERENQYLDSISDRTVYNFFWMRPFTYKECKSREINLGLDLKGGMNVKMEVSTADVVKNLTTNPDDVSFKKLFNASLALQKVNGKKFIDCFDEVMNRQENKGINLSAFFRIKLKERKITATSSNSEVLAAIRAECTDAYDRTFQVLSKRIDKFGVSQPTIQKLQASERILIELPGVKDPQRVSRLLEGTAQLEFWLAGDASKVRPAFNAADEYLATMKEEDLNDTVYNSADTTINPLGKDTIKPLADKNENKTTAKSTNSNKRPLLSLFSHLNNGDMYPTVIGTASGSKRKEINRLLTKAAKVLPSDVTFFWSAKPIQKTNEFELYVIQYTNKAKTALLDGDVIDDARQDFDQKGSPVVSMKMKSDAAKKWGKITGSNVGNCIAIVLDSVVYSAPRVNSEITGGNSEISGNFSIDEAKDLANILKSGKLTAPARVVQESVVGPSLGAESVHAGLMSFILAFIVVCIYMIFFYNIAGLAACVALFVNMFFLFGVLASIGAVLTLAGIASIVLTLAMAVDANVIINERIKEELAAGKAMSAAIHDGYKAAYSAIIDGNVTTLITGIVLAYVASGSVQGFALILCIGILTSVFSSIFVSRLIFEAMLASKKWKEHLTFFNKITKDFMEHTNFHFTANAKKALIICGTIVVICLSSIIFKGMEYGIDFSGGRTYVVRFDQDVQPTKLRESLTKQLGNAPEVKTFGPNYQVKITTDFKVKEDNEAVKKEAIHKLFVGLKPFYKNQNITESDFQSTLHSPLGIISSEIVGSTIANDVKRSAVIAVIIALVCIFIYIAIRFKKWQYGLGGLVALAFDTTLIIGVFSIFSGILPFSLEVDMNFIAAILTIIGYSINDTVIIFDRVRENVRLYPNENYGKLMDLAMNQTLSRTVNTVGTTVVALIVILFFGGEVLRGFAFALTIGIISGAFSTLFIAAPIAFLLLTKKEKQNLAKQDLLKGRKK